MNSTTTAISKTLSTLAIDAVLVGLVLLMPTLSHLTALPFYRLNPMLLLLLADMLFGGNRYNSMLLAVALPFVSYLAVGMPTATKALCMAAELLTLTVVYPLVRQERTSLPAIWLSSAAAMLCAKGGYYLLKMVLIGGILVETSPTLQLVTVAGYSLLFAAATVALRRSRDRRCGHDRC